MTCPRCDADISTQMIVPEPDSASADDSSGVSLEGDSEISCPECKTVFESQVLVSLGNCSVSLKDFPKVRVSADNPYYCTDPVEAWTFLGFTKNPYEVFKESFEQSSRLMSKLCEENGDSLINRMVFSQLIGSMEAYLADTLIAKVLASQKALSALVLNERELSKTTVSLADAITGQPAVEKLVTNYLRSILYHNLPRVNHLYSIALNVNFMKDKKQTATLLKAVKHRHDCVHRNGRTLDGEILDVFTIQYLFDVAGCVRNLVDGVELSLQFGTDFFDETPF